MWPKAWRDMVRTEATSGGHPMGKSKTCGAELQDLSRRFCGGDRCSSVFMQLPSEEGRSGRRAWVRRWARSATPGSYREQSADVVDVSVVSVLGGPRSGVGKDRPRSD